MMNPVSSVSQSGAPAFAGAKFQQQPIVFAAGSDSFKSAQPKFGIDGGAGMQAAGLLLAGLVAAAAVVATVLGVVTSLQNRQKLDALKRQGKADTPEKAVTDPTSKA